MITNKAMPGLIKVGYSTKDPELRAIDLNHTGSPYPYLVEYELLIDEPYLIEQKSHKKLAHCREGKEWFRCEPEEAIAAIKQIAGIGIIHEEYKRAERAKAEAILQESIRVKEEQEKAKRAKSRSHFREKLVEEGIEVRLRSEEESIRAKYKSLFFSQFSERPFWHYWLGTTVCTLIIGVIFEVPDGALFLVFIGGFIGAFFAQDHFEVAKKKSPEYIALGKQMETDIAEVRAKVVTCTSCGNKIRFERSKILLGQKGTRWSCPRCNSLVSSPYDA